MAIVPSFLTKKKPNFIVNYHLIWKHFNDFYLRESQQFIFL